jgi:hypothetical protein
MKTNKRTFFAAVLMLAAYLLSACAGAVPQTDESTGDQAAIKVRASEVAFTGVVDAISGGEWTVNGQVLTIDPAVVRDGPFQVGDTVKVEGTVNADGSFTVSRLEAPSAEDLAVLPQLGADNQNANDNLNDNANENANDDSLNGNSNDDNSNDDDANENSNDDNSNDDDQDGSGKNGNSNDDDHASNSGKGGSDDNGDDDD